MIKISVQKSDFDAGLEISKLSELGGGAVSSFVGQVRGDKQLQALELEYYPAMTEKALREIAKQATGKWPIHGLVIIHRVGRMAIGDQIVLTGVCSDHRHAAISACSFLMDQLKTVAPFWKKEIMSDGVEKWVDERQSDIDAAQNWRN
ncbi:MAG: molybdenum cofactor biosynthesis protein MoaE [Parasphingorhabdus sp.]|uniref:molybdenum cofactor biosynthesis protein MoaE n=1 Tax=Parasphingorhabdus sp. TaxID=2709688 RepID=UPI003299817B